MIQAMGRPPVRAAVVINADDLGLSSATDRAILESFGANLITSASLMTNMPAFEDAVALVRGAHLDDRIGVHLNLTDGRPLTEPIRHLPGLCDPTGSLLRRRGSVWRLSREEAAAIELELSAQVAAALEAGLTPSHLDSHHHVHTQWPIASIVLRIAAAHRIPMIRLARNCGPMAAGPRQLYKSVLNRRLRRHGMAGTRYFGSAADAATLVEPSGPVEIMVHPQFDGSGRLIDATTGAGPLEAASDAWRNVGRLVSYRDLRS
jgi:chitin disaccharide deacetylase